MPTEKSAGAVVFRKEKDTIKYLLLHYELGHWDLPKGHIEKGEKPEEAAVREVREETGIKDIEFIPGFKETIKYFYKRDDKSFLKTVVFFLARTKTKKVKISYEHQGFKWLSYDKALEQLTFDNAKRILKKSRQFLSNPK
ncbi:MAG: NUDIX domain-containing protein [Candidatus Nealsonbacteria bacterium]|nr:NUDIX domain-containing protein [Candidatus Nealsonbacteria bacterium]